MSELKLWMCDKCWASGLLELSDDDPESMDRPKAEAAHKKSSPKCNYVPHIMKPSRYLLDLYTKNAHLRAALAACQEQKEKLREVLEKIAGVKHIMPSEYPGDNVEVARAALSNTSQE